MRPILFFDGACGLCQRSVQWLAARDGGWCEFAPLGGATFREQVGSSLMSIPDSLVIRAADGRVLTEGAAVAEALRLARWPWTMGAVVLRILPARLLNEVYRLVARRRHRAWSRRVCEMTPSLRDRLRP